MAEQVILPSMGFAILDAKVVQWLKNEGDPVKKEEPIVEVETDKLTFEVFAPCDGFLLKQLYGVGDVAEVNHSLAVVGAMGEQVGAAVIDEKAEKAAAVPDTASHAGHTESAHALQGRKRAMPAAKELCRRNQIDLNLLEGSGPDGVIVRKDVEAYLASAGEQAGKAAAPKKRATPAAKGLIRQNGLDINAISGTGADGVITREDVEAFMQGGGKSVALPQSHSAGSSAAGAAADERIPFTGVRRTIADNLSRSKNNAVHVTTMVEVDMTESYRMRNRFKDHFEARYGSRLSFVPFFLKAAVLGIREFPILNATLDGEFIVVKKNVDFCVAVDSPKGLLVPVLKNAETLSLWEMARRVNEMTAVARTGSLKPEFYGAGTISISNAGAFGAVQSTPIIQYPHSAVVWTGAIQDKPAVVEGQIVPRKLMNLCVSYDHRIMDGAKVAQFLGIMKKSLEALEILIVD